MTIETKYNIGDEVWIMWKNKALRGEICNVIIERGIGFYGFSDSERYQIGFNIRDVMKIDKNTDEIDNMPPLSIGDLFPTKEELLKSL